MFSSQPNPFLQVPGKTVLDIDRGRMPSGQVVEIRSVEVIRMDNGLWRKEKVHEVVPGLADGTTPAAIEDIRECHVCLRLFHKDNVLRCPTCGRDYCCFEECCGRVQVSESEEVALCAVCAREANTGFWARLVRRFWGLGESP